MKTALVLTEGPESEAFRLLFEQADAAMLRGEGVSVFADVEGVKAMRGATGPDEHDLSALQARGATVVLCRLCTMRLGLDIDPAVLASASLGDIDDLSRMLAAATDDAAAAGSCHVVVHITSAPHDGEPDRAVEGLRAAVGLLRAAEEHTVDVVLDGVADALLKSDRVPERPMLAQLRAGPDTVYVTRAESAGEVVTHIDEAGLRELLERADVVLRY